MEARVDQLLRMADLVRAGDIDSRSRGEPRSKAQLFNQKRAHVIERMRDPTVIQFFTGMRTGCFREERSTSVVGRRSEEKCSMRWERSLEWSDHGTERLKRPLHFAASE
jgi:hypothetical protein